MNPCSTFLTSLSGSANFTSSQWLHQFPLFIVLTTQLLIRGSLSLQSQYQMPHDEHMIATANQRNDGQEGKATTAFYTHTRCQWNQYTPPQPATASGKCFPTDFSRFTSTPISIHRVIKAKECHLMQIYLWLNE